MHDRVMSATPAPALPHPRTGAGFLSPVPPASGWPGDPAGPATPVARSAADVVRLAGGCADLAALDAASSVCRACPRLVAWRAVSYTHLRAHETVLDLVCRL